MKKYLKKRYSTMNNYNNEELENRIKNIEKELKQIDRLDRETFELTENLNRVIKYLVDIVENDVPINKNDIDYVFLKLGIDAIKHHEIPLFISKTERMYRKTGKFPSLRELHQHILDILSLPKEDEPFFSIEVTITLLKKYVEYDEFTVCKEILLTK
jgi:hypothetical protein